MFNDPTLPDAPRRALDHQLGTVYEAPRIGTLTLPLRDINPPDLDTRGGRPLPPYLIALFGPSERPEPFALPSCLCSGWDTSGGSGIFYVAEPFIEIPDGVSGPPIDPSRIVDTGPYMISPTGTLTLAQKPDISRFYE